MGLDSLPTRTTGSLGPVKVDLAPPADRVHHLAASDWNTAAALLMELSETIGLADGSTPGSLAEHLRALVGAAHLGNRWAHFEDFDMLSTDSNGPWGIATASSGTLTGPLSASSAPADVDGFGWLNLSVINTGGSFALIRRRQNVARPGANPIFRARIKLPTNLAHGFVSLGFRAIAGGPGAWVEVDPGGWILSIASTEGGSSTVAYSGALPVAGAIYEVEIAVVEAESVTLSLRPDGETEWTEVLALGIGDDPDAIPRGTDALSWFVGLDRAGAGASDLYVDWIHVEGDR